MSQPAPGWYPDPAGSQRLRWWNGGEWTVQFHDMPQQGAPVAQQMPIAQAAGSTCPPTPASASLRRSVALVRVVSAQPVQLSSFLLRGAPAPLLAHGDGDVHARTIGGAIVVRHACLRIGHALVQQ